MFPLFLLELAVNVCSISYRTDMIIYEFFKRGHTKKSLGPDAGKEEVEK